MKNHYQTLGIPNLSSMADVKKAYRSLALRHHPDRGGEIRKMQEVNAAYEYLVKHKEEYDRTLRPSRPALRTYGFTIVVNGFGYGFSGKVNVNEWMEEATRFTSGMSSTSSAGSW